MQAAFQHIATTTKDRLHPLVVWDAVTCGGASREELVAGLPVHMAGKVHRQLDALAVAYLRVLQLLKEDMGEHDEGRSTGKLSLQDSSGELDVSPFELHERPVHSAG